MSFCLYAMGTAVPEHGMSQQEATELAKKVICRSEQQSRLLEILYRKAGVEQRYTVLPHRIALQWLPHGDQGPESDRAADTLGPTTGERMAYYAEHGPPLAEQAARRALDRSGLGRQEITHLITVSCTGFDAPGLDVHLIAQLGLSSQTQRLHVGYMGCHAAINGLRAADAIAAADSSARILLCAVELCSLHYRFRWDPERLVANALFGDGAAAVVGGAGGPRFEDAWRVERTGSILVPDSKDAMSWRIGDHGFEMTLHARVPELIQRHLRPWLSEWLTAQGHSLETVSSWAIHPGGPRILAAIEESLMLPRNATAVSREILGRFGNMSSPTALFIVERLRELGAPRPCVALGFGPGMFAEAALFM